MPCTSSLGNSCRTYKSYAGGAYYHGELCGGCPWWQDTREDRDFKERVQEIKDSALDFKQRRRKINYAMRKEVVEEEGNIE